MRALVLVLCDNAQTGYVLAIPGEASSLAPVLDDAQIGRNQH
jgi:hypothetical protein